MKVLLLFAFCLAVAQAVEIENRALDVCYGELGCFSVRNPFSGTIYRPIGVLPQSEETINTKFCLFTRANPTTHKLITHQALDPLFDPSKPTKFIIHGWLSEAFSKYLVDMKDAFLSVGDFNVIIVDWTGGNGMPYDKAVGNTRMVGALIARLVNTYAKNYGLNVDDVHIIGHSLGAHTAGYAGERITGLGRITGLDPAGPAFEFTDKVVRLDETDAKFVDVIHTDGAGTFQLGLGLMQKSGHVDFYVNGGKDQPNCPQTAGKIIAAVLSLFSDDLVQGIMDTSACSHMSAVYFFTDSIRNAQCRYTAYPCNSQDDLNKGNCGSCGTSGCNQMGFHASASKDKGSLYLSTQDADKYPYCDNYYLITLNSNNLFGQTQTSGWFKITLHGDVRSSSPILLSDNTYAYKPGSVLKKFKPSTVYLGETVQSATLLFDKANGLLAWLYQDQWSFKNIQILYGNNQNSVTLCPDQTYIKTGTSVTFRKC